MNVSIEDLSQPTTFLAILSFLFSLILIFKELAFLRAAEGRLSGKMKDYRGTSSLKGKQDSYPNVSIVVPMKNEVENAEGCLQSLLSQNYNGKCEIIICLPDERDPTMGALSKFRSEKQISVVYSYEVGKSIQMQKAVSEARYEFVAFLDADCRPSKNWLKTMVTTLKENNADSVSSGFFVRGNSPLSHAQSYDVPFLLCLGATHKGGLIWEGNHAMTKSSFLSFGGLANTKIISVTEDFRGRVLSSGIRHIATFHPDAVVELAPKKSFRDIFWQRVRWISMSFQVGYPAVYLVRYGAYMPLLFFFLFFTALGAFLYSFAFLILLITYYLIDIFYTNRIFRMVNLPFQRKSILYHLPYVLCLSPSFFTGLFFFKFGRSEKWSGGKFKE